MKPASSASSLESAPSASRAEQEGALRTSRTRCGGDLPGSRRRDTANDDVPHEHAARPPVFPQRGRSAARHRCRNADDCRHREHGELVEHRTNTLEAGVRRPTEHAEDGASRLERAGAANSLEVASARRLMARTGWTRSAESLTARRRRDSGAERRPTACFACSTDADGFLRRRRRGRRGSSQDAGRRKLAIAFGATSSTALTQIAMTPPRLEPPARDARRHCRCRAPEVAAPAAAAPAASRETRGGGVLPLPPPPAGLPGLPDPSKLLAMMQQAKAETPTGG